MRQRQTNKDLPSCVYVKCGTYYYVKNNKWINLGKDKRKALAEYARLISVPVEGVSGLLNRWLADVDIAPNTRRTYRHAVKVLSEAFAEFEPWQVTARDVLAFVHHHRKNPASANLYRNVLSLAMDFAFMENTIERNVVSDVKPYKTATRERYITDAEYEAIRSKATPTLRVVMDLCLLTGQRISDVLGVRYSDLTDEGILFKQMKTGKRMVVSWSDELEQVVANAKSLHTVLRGLTILHTRRGTPFTYSTIRTLWDRARKAARVEDAHIHDIRAKAATDAKKQGLDSQALLGHRSESSHNRYLRSKETAVAFPASFRNLIKIGQK